MKADAVKIADDVYWVGALDWDNRDFHGFAVPGMTYNAFLVFGDEKTALIDNVFEGFFPEFWARIEDAFKQEGLDEVKIDVLVQNHIENDHIGSIPELLEKCPDIEFYCSAVAVSGLKKRKKKLLHLLMHLCFTGQTVISLSIMKEESYFQMMHLVNMYVNLKDLTLINLKHLWSYILEDFMLTLFHYLQCL